MDKIKDHLRKARLILRYVRSFFTPGVHFIPLGYSRGRLPLGWIEVSPLRQTGEEMISVTIYLDTLKGFSEQEKVEVRFNHKVDRVLLRLPRLLRSIRVDCLSEEVKGLHVKRRFALGVYFGKFFRSKNKLSLLKKSCFRLISYGSAAARVKLLEADASPGDHDTAYLSWIKGFDTLSNTDREKIREKIKGLSKRPKFSILMPAYNTPVEWLKEAVESVAGQIYPDWELCIADDCSTDETARSALSGYTDTDDRIKVTFRESNGNISAATNTALEMATGDFIVLLDHDDRLAPHALFMLADALSGNDSLNLLYSDEDRVDRKGKRSEPYFKPAWSESLMLSQNLVSHLGAYRTSIAKKIGGFRVGFEGSQDWDFALRFIREIDHNSIHHIPFVLYHWRKVSGTVSHDAHSQTSAFEAGRRSISDYLEASNVHGASVSAIDGFCKVNYSALRANERVEIVSADSRSLPETNKEFICFLAESATPTTDRWLEELVSQASLSGVGVVGGRHRKTTGEVLNSGFVLGAENGVGTCFASQNPLSVDRTRRFALVQELSAVSINCFMVRRELFEELGGFDPNYQGALYDVDFCLRARAKGYRIVFTPYADFVSSSEELHSPTAADLKYFREKWSSQIESDPFYNPNLDLETANFTLAFPPRVKRPW